MKLQDIFNDNMIVTLEELKADPELVFQIEIRLNALGLLDNSNADGTFSDATEAALFEFCRISFLNNMETQRFGRIFAKKLIEMKGPIPNAAAPQAIQLNLTNSVGRGGGNNPNDVKSVRDRLVDLGYSWVGRGSTMNSEVIRTIMLFQSIINGDVIVRGVDGRVDINGKTQRYLESADAPQWQEMPIGSTAEGFINFDHQQGDTHDFGTSWMINAVRAAATLYLNTFRSSRPSSALLATNNLSVVRGGPSSIHQTHQTGLSCDILLPKKNGTFGGITFRDPSYDRDAMEAMLLSLRRQDRVEIRQIFFNDFALVAKGLCVNLNDGGVHDNHAHVDISALDI
jgi:hypothetical protein